MSFGFGIGDFLAVGQLAFRVYRRCKDSAEQYKAASIDLANMHIAIKDVTETIIEKELSAEKQDQLARLC
jgi:hypothetical protein